MRAAPAGHLATCTRIAVRSGLLLVPWVLLAEGLWIVATAGGFVVSSLGPATALLRYAAYAGALGAAIAVVTRPLTYRLPPRGAGPLLFGMTGGAFFAIEAGMYVFDIVAPFGSIPSSRMALLVAGILVAALAVTALMGAGARRIWTTVERILDHATWPTVLLACALEASGTLAILHLAAVHAGRLEPDAAAGPDHPNVSPNVSPNVLLIVLDTVRADALSSSGNPLAHTPYLDRLAAEGIRFARAISSSTWTPPGHASLFTGLYPISHGTRGRNPILGGAVDVLPAMLHRAGYATLSLYNNPLAGRVTAMDRGFDAAIGVETDNKVSFVDERLYNKFVRGDSGAHKTGDLLEAWVEERHRQRQPWMAFVNLNDAHTPYIPRQPWMDAVLQKSRVDRAQVDQPAVWRAMSESGREEFLHGDLRLTDTDFAWLRAAYYSEVSATDDELRRTLEGMRHRGLLEHTIIVITADHGEAIGESGRLGHANELFGSVVSIPLILWAPAQLAPRTDNRWASLVDVLPTLLELTGTPRGPSTYHLEGRSLLSPDRPDEAIAEDTTVDEPACDSFLLVRGPQAFRQGCDGQSTAWTISADAFALWREVPPEAAAADGWRADLASWHDACVANRDGRAAASTVETNPAVRERLRSLGYIK